MIPKRLPNLCAAAVRTAWQVSITHNGTTWNATFTKHGPHRTNTVWLLWHEGVLRESRINDHPTPYTQCTRLIRSPEGATS